jgi:hypothetical protein
MPNTGASDRPFSGASDRLVGALCGEFGFRPCDGTPGFQVGAAAGQLLGPCGGALAC